MTEGELNTFYELAKEQSEEVEEHFKKLLRYIEELHAQLGKGNEFGGQLLNALRERILEDPKVDNARLDGACTAVSLTTHIVGGHVSQLRENAMEGADATKVVVDVRLVIGKPRNPEVIL